MHADIKIIVLCQELFPDKARECPQFMRHKVHARSACMCVHCHLQTSMISPAMIEKAGIPIETIRQYPGEFVFNLPHGYHCGGISNPPAIAC